MRVTGLVLAGGHSRRMGTDKATLVIEDGRTLLERQVALLRESGLDEVVISRRRGQPSVETSARVLLDEAEDSGPLAGIATAMAETNADLLLVIPIDMPFLGKEVIRQLLALASPGRGVVPHRGDTIECLVGLYPCTLASLAASRVAAGQLKVREFAAIAEETGHAIRWEIPPELVPAFRNWNKPEDVEKMPPGSAGL